MELLINNFPLPAYPSVEIPLNEHGRNFIRIRATYFFADNKDGHRVIQKVYWVIAYNETHVFTKNLTWVQEPRHKTDKFREKAYFESIQEAIAFTEKHWEKIKL